MGILSKALSPPSSYAAKKTTLWDDLTDELEACLYPAQLETFVENFAAIEHTIPLAWMESIEELIEKKRIEIEEDDVSRIMRSRFDF